MFVDQHFEKYSSSIQLKHFREKSKKGKWQLSNAGKAFIYCQSVYTVLLPSFKDTFGKRSKINQIASHKEDRVNNQEVFDVFETHLSPNQYEDVKALIKIYDSNLHTIKESIKFEVDDL